MSDLPPAGAADSKTVYGSVYFRDGDGDDIDLSGVIETWPGWAEYRPRGVIRARCMDRDFELRGYSGVSDEKAVGSKGDFLCIDEWNRMWIVSPTTMPMLYERIRELDSTDPVSLQVVATDPLESMDSTEG